MARFEYALNENGNVVYPKKLTISDINSIFVCPTPDCNAKLKLCSVDGKVSAYFKSANIKEHSNHCFLCKETFNSSKYCKDTIDLNKILNTTINSKNNKTNNSSKNNKLNNNTKIIKLLPANSFKTTFNILKQTDINEYISSVKVSYLIADTRTDFLYNTFITGIKIVECKLNKYKTNSDLPYFIASYPINKETLKLTIKFKNLEDFKFVLENIKEDGNLSFSTKNHFVGIIANWSNNSCIIENKKQVIFPNYKR